jgi:hypothetical protein
MAYKFNIFTGTFDIVGTVASDPHPGYDFLLEDGTLFLLEDGTSTLLLEG